MQLIKVKKIHEIEGIENYLNEIFVFKCYADWIKTYSYLDGEMEVCLELISSNDFDIFFGKEKLSDLITEDFTFLRFTYSVRGSVIKSFEILDKNKVVARSNRNKIEARKKANDYALTQSDNDSEGIIYSFAFQAYYDGYLEGIE